MAEMKVICFKAPGKAADVLEVTTVPKPKPEANDLLVKLKACAINPVDTKVRQGGFPIPHNILGFDAAGLVEAVGSSVKTFKPGDEVYYAGSISRPGSTAQYNLIDHRLAALKPKNRDWVQSACIPLVTITAWEVLEEHFNLVQDDPSSTQQAKSILVINGAGGVGSIATQLARHVFKLGKVVVTASRHETIAHSKSMGATHVINHRGPLKPQLQRTVGIEGVDYIIICHSTNAYMSQAIDVANPRARIASIVEIESKLEAMHEMTSFTKQIRFSWEFMFSKMIYRQDLESIGDILRRAAKLFEEGRLKDLVTERGILSVENLVKAHEKLESGNMVGKLGLDIGEDIE